MKFGNQPPHSSVAYEFGPFRVSIAERVVTKGQQVIPLTPKAFDTLVVLVRNSGHVVEKDELLKEVWPDTFVEEGVLAVNVAAIRKALSDGDEGRSYIETVPRRGYRFVGEVQTLGKMDERGAAVNDVSKRKKSLTRPWALAAALLAPALAGIGWYLSLSPSIPIPEPSSPVPLTSYPGTELSPTFSPDGTQVAFSWDGEHQDNFDIYVKPVDRVNAHRLTRDPARDMSPPWSPDGRYIAFAREGAVFLIPPTVGAERKVADVGAADLEWTRDSKSLIVTGTSRKLLSLSVDTGQTKELTSPPSETDPAFLDFKVAVSPDGLKVAFVRSQTSSTGDLYLMPVTGGELRRLTQNESQIYGVTWTADGLEIVYSSQGRLLRRSTEARPDSPSERVQGVDPTRALAPVISRPAAGSPVRLAYERMVLDTNIWVKDTQDPSAPARKSIWSTRFDDSPQFSPDGSQIAFTSSSSSDVAQIWVANNDGSNPLQLTSFSAGLTTSPRWSPDGSRIVFSSMQNNNRDLYSVSPDGSSLGRLTEESSEEGRPSWSRDGRWIYCYSKRTGTQEIWKIPAEGGKAVQVTVGGGHEAFESPDGKLLYYEDYGITGLRSLSTENSSGPRKGTLVLSAVRPGYWAVAERGIYFVQLDDWSPTAQFMYYAFVVGATSAPQPIKFYDFQSRRVTQIGAIQKGLIRHNPGFSVTWDGRTIAWSQVDQGETDLMMVENFR
jgi:Tol biopolymer transport system component/DNA-binding winged helix-turn-helix (wHTH) protein